MKMRINYSSKVIKTQDKNFLYKTY